MSRRLMLRGVRTARAVRAVITNPPYVAPGHYYSPHTSSADRARALTWSGAPGVDATAVQTVGAKGYDGFSIAIVGAPASTP